MVIKTIVSIYFTRKTLFFLSRRGAEMSSILLHKLLAQNLQVVQERSLQQNLYALTAGVSTITVGVLGTAVGLIADLSLLIVMMMGLFVVDTMIAISTFLIFGGVGFVLYRIMHLKVQILGKRQAILNIVSNQKIYEVLQGYREIIVRNRLRYYADQIGKQRLELADVGAEIAFMPSISKYALEVTLVVGFY
jgi:ABC-type transport system involved in cytochrome bd biosynthesis fused ATPase/permease subunit